MRYVVLRHEMPPGQGRGLHWDLMLESGDVLRTWALPQEPGSGMQVEADALADHRPAYLDYEGPVSGNRGMVTRFDRGTYMIVRESELELVADMTGEKLRGRLRLVRQADDIQRWDVTFEPG